ncbi:MAG TPA: alpha-glucosidase [Gemmatimonadales bacterium]|nr:alpha-glucosidase [Gemmatimonadales bacterium]
MLSRRRRAGAVCIALLLSAASAAPAPSQRDAEGHAWWQHAVFYEVYPRSFGDANNDGLGDLDGITQHLDYLKDLGVDAIWITPCYPSPQVDFGYDVSDYEGIAPEYGGLAAFDRLQAEAKRRGIRIIFDLVVNHSSDKHAWFLESRSSRTNPKRNWYVWRDGKGPDQPPNNWTAIFGGSAWQYDSTTRQYYYHAFYPQQPDLNWRNPAVEKAMLEVTRWWYRRGISGFRLDAVNTLFEDPQLRDNPTLPGRNAYGDQNQIRKYDDNLPENHLVLRKLRQVADEHNAVLIGETWTDDIKQLEAYYGPKHDEVQMPMDLMFTQLGRTPGTPGQRLDAPTFRRHVAAMEASGEWPVYVVSNHDILRVATRFADGQHDDQIAKAIAAFYLTLRGTPVMYYGEELGMQNNDPQRKEDVRDPIGIKGWPLEKGRDGERTPMQWSGGPNAGFNAGAKPWLPVLASAATHNVDAESRDTTSVLSVYKRVLRLRHENVAVREGSYVALNQDDPNVMSYLRRYKDDAVIVVINTSGQDQTATFDLAAQGLGGRAARPIVESGASGGLSGVKLGPYGVYIADLSR